MASLSAEVFSLHTFLHPNAEAYVNHSSVTVLSGADALKHLDRSLTSTISDIENLDKRQSLLCDANGRIVDMVSICYFESQIILFGWKDSTSKQKLLQGIGWNEDVELFDADRTISNISIVGNSCNRVLVGLGIDASEFSQNSWVEYGNALLSVRLENNIEIFEVALPTVELESFLKLLVENGCSIIEKNRWKSLRMQIGILEMPDLFGNLPLEVGLDDWVMLDKGCYPGQEVHARLESRGRVAKSLMRLDCESELECGKLKIEGIGTINITSTSLFDDSVIAFALLPSSACELECININDTNTAFLRRIRNH